MSSASIMLVFLMVFVVFTGILGTGLLFFQSTVADSAASPIAGQLGAGVIMFLFAAGAMLFLVGTTKMMAARYKR